MTGLKRCPRCPRCSTVLVRCHRRGVWERVVLAPVPWLRPFRCTRCEFRGLRLTTSLDRRRLLLVAALLALGLILVQLVWDLRTGAPEHPGGGYQPRDLERQRYLEERQKR